MKKDPALHLGHFARVRSKIMRSQPDEIDDVLFVEGIIQAVFQRTDSNELAKRILYKYKTLDNLITNATVSALEEIEGIGKNSAEKITSILRLLDIYHSRNAPQTLRVNAENFNDILKILDKYFKNEDAEKLVLFLMDKRENLVFHKAISQGFDASVSVNIADIISLAKRHDSPYIALAHNHPNSSMFPSAEDLAVTERLFLELKQADIALIDHVIYADGDLFSFANMGILFEFERKINEKMSKIKKRL